MVPGPWCRLLLPSVRTHCLSLMSAPSTAVHSHRLSGVVCCLPTYLPGDSPCHHLGGRHPRPRFFFPLSLFFFSDPQLWNLSSMLVLLVIYHWGLILEICKMWYIVSWGNSLQEAQISVLPIVNILVVPISVLARRYSEFFWIFVGAEILLSFIYIISGRKY